MKSKGLLGLILAILAIIIIVFIFGNKASKQAELAQTAVQADIVLADGVYNLDAANSRLGWNATKVGGAHSGTVGLKSGSITVVNNAVTAGTIEADVATLTSTDLDDVAMNTKLVTHLKSADFFDVAKYPTATLSVANWKKAESGYVISADITIKGITKRMDIPVIVSTEGTSIIMDGLFTIDQSDFKIVSGTLADIAISDEIQFSFKSVFTAK